MLLSTKSHTLMLFVAVCFATLAGCGDGKKPADDAAGKPADPHDIPLTAKEIDQLRQDTATWAAAIQHVQSFRDTIRTETTDGEPAKAHRALDQLDHVLKWLPEIAQKSSIPKEQSQDIGETAQQLRDLFDKIHANIDRGQAPDYESMAGEIDAAIKKLAAIKSE